METILTLKRPSRILLLFFAVAAVIFAVWLGIRYFRGPDSPPASVTLTPAQARELTEQITYHQDSVYNANETIRRKEMSDAFARYFRSDSAYFHFQQQQNKRNEKYNHILTASDAELYGFFADRYGR